MTQVIVAVIGLVGILGAQVLIWAFNRRKLDEIHVLVNSRLSDALKRIDELSARLGIDSVESDGKEIK